MKPTEKDAEETAARTKAPELLRAMAERLEFKPRRMKVNGQTVKYTEVSLRKLHS